MLRDTLTVCRRQVRMNLRNPGWVLFGLMQPVLYLLLFGPLLRPLAAQFGAGDAYAFFVPGLLVQLGLFGGLFVGFGLVAELRQGVVEAERVTPASRTALLAGRVLRDVLMLVVQVVLLLALAWAMGMRADPLGVLVGGLLTLVLGATGAAASYACALLVRSEDAMAGLTNSVQMPIMLLSGILLPMTLGPLWLRGLSAFMPTRWVVDGARAAFAGDLASRSVAVGVGTALVLLVAALAWGASTFRRASA